MLTIQNAHTYYGAIAALRGVDLTVPKGEIITLIGANGAGKSTLLMTICGNPAPRTGSIQFEGRDITKLQPYEIAQLGIAQVPEGRRIFGRMTVLENLQLGARLAKKENYQKNLDNVFHLFPRLQERRDQRAGTMSGGEQQMLAIGRALMSEPKLLLLDEPSLGLAPLLVKQIFEIIRVIKEQGMTIFLVEQNAHHALQLADHAYVMVNGQIALSGTGDELLKNPQVRAAYLEGV